jgi:hypothetical protein
MDESLVCELMALDILYIYINRNSSSYYINGQHRKQFD